MNAVVDVEVNAVFDVDLLYFLRSLTKVGKYGQFMRHSFNGPLFVFLSSLFHCNDHGKLTILARLHALHLYPQVLWYYGSSAAIPFFTLVALLALWFGVSVPLTFVGAYFGFRLYECTKDIEKVHVKY